MQSLTLDEIKQVLHAAADDTERLAILVTFWHGLRASELCSLTGERIQDGYLDVKRLKGSNRTRQKFIVQSDPLLDESAPLRQRAKELKPRQLLFTNRKGEAWTRYHFHYLFAKAAKRAGLPKHKRHPHCLKHSIAMQIIGSGIENTRQWLGHKSIQSTGEYLKVDDEQAGAAVIAAVGGL